MADVKHKSQRSETKLIGEVRIAFPFHHEKRTKSAGGALLDKPRHDAVVLVPKLNPDPTKCSNYTTLAGLCMEAATKAWGAFPQGGKWPIQDGDVPHVSKPKPGVVPKTTEQLAASNAWRVGNWVIEVSTNLDPGPKVCVMQNGVPTEIPAKVIAGVQLYKSGDYGYVSLNAYSFENQTFGCNFGYEGVLYTRPGEPIGSGGQRSATQMFGSVVPAQGGASQLPLPGAPTAPSATAAVSIATGYAVPPMPPSAPLSMGQATVHTPLGGPAPSPLPPMPPMPNAAPPLPR